MLPLKADGDPTCTLGFRNLVLQPAIFESEVAQRLSTPGVAVGKSKKYLSKIMLVLKPATRRDKSLNSLV